MRIKPLHGFLLTALFSVVGVTTPVRAQVTISLTGEHGTSEGACLHSTEVLGGLDCTYGGTNLVGTPGGWAGPSLGGAYYAAGSEGDSTLYVPFPDDGKVRPSITGTLQINGVGDDATISGTIVIGAAVRNLASGESDRTIQRWTSITHTLAPTPVSSAAANSNGGFNYVVGSLGAPEDICLAADGVCFGLHESGSDPVAGPAGTWGAGGIAGARPAIGISALEALAGASATGGEDRRNIGAATTAVIEGDSCDSTDVDDCLTGETVWGRGEDAGFDNLILVFSTTFAGEITAGRAWWSQDYRQALGGEPAGDNSTRMGTFTFAGPSGPPTCADFIVTVDQDSSDNVISAELQCANVGDAFTAVILAGPENGTAAVDEAGRIIYTPNPGYAGIDTISYAGGDGVSSDDGVITIAVEADLPVVAPDGALDLSTQGVAPSTVSGSLDVAGLPGYSGGNPPGTVTAGNGTSGTVTVTGSVVTYQPDADFYAGSDSFTYTVADRNGDTGVGTVVVTIQDLSPLITDGNLETDRNQASLPQALGITAGNGAPGQHALTVATDGANGNCSLTADDATGQLIYTPDPEFFGTDSCVLSLVDGDGDADAATISITVNEDPDPTTPPVITSSAPPDGRVGNAYSFSYAATGTTPISWTVTSGALPPGLTLGSGGLISGTPTAEGTYTGVVTASNGTLPDDTQGFSITIARQGGGSGGGGGGSAMDALSLMTMLLTAVAAGRGSRRRRPALR